MTSVEALRCGWDWRYTLVSCARAAAHRELLAALDRWANRRQIVPPELIGRIAPTHVECINLRGILRFPIGRFAPQLLPSHTEPKLRAIG